jgi:WD40 repeat protein
MVKSITFSPDSKYVVSASRNVYDLEDNAVEIWDAGNGACLRTLKGYSHSINNALFDISLHESQQHIYCISADKAWITWNGQNVLRLPPEYRGSSSAVAAGAIVIGCSSGQVLIIKFSFDKSPLS